MDRISQSSLPRSVAPSIGNCCAVRWASVVAVVLLALLGLEGAGVVAQRNTPPTSDFWTTADAAEAAAVFYETTVTIPTYPYAAYLETVVDATYNIAYPVLDWDAYLASNPIAVPRRYDLLVMENDYLRVTLLPELGGRIYQLFDKTTGHNQLYQNPVIKPTRWGPPEQGWWLSAGGIEWCLPVDEHGYEWGVPWHWSVVTSTFGVTVTLRDTYASDRLRATIDVSLPATQAYVAVTPHLENPTASPVDFKFWINASLAPGAANRPTEDLAFVFNAPEMSVHSTGDSRLPGAFPTMPTSPIYHFSWPEYGGVDYAHLRNWSEWLGFFEYPQAAKGFMGLYAEAQNEGVVRVFPPEVARGAKGFAVGWSRPLDWHSWTDSDSGGVELHGGLAPTFWDTARLPPAGTVSWRELWYPVHNTGGVVVAAEEAALNVTVTGGVATAAVQPTQPWASDETEVFVWKRTTCEELAHWTLPALNPTQAYHSGVAVGDLTLDELAVAYVDSGHTVLAGYGPTDCLDFEMPAPHLGYGINLRLPQQNASLVPPLGFDWVKLRQETSEVPAAPLPQKVLYNVACGAYVNDLGQWGNAIGAIAQAGLGKVQAYEICDEPNVRGADWAVSAPDPGRFAQMLCIAWDRIKAVDPDALVISGGLAPVGRIPAPWPCGEGNDCAAMDEWRYLEAMLDHGAGGCMDAFGYHPYGFASPPERDPDEISNAFTFRGVEKLREILVGAKLETLPVWATDFNWLRRPADDGFESCDAHADYLLNYRWQEVSAVDQADYLVRAFQYADTHWPWMQGMFVWNLDWHTYLPDVTCLPSRYYALLRRDGALTPAYLALIDMDKRPGLLSLPVLSVVPERQMLLAELAAPRVLTTSFLIANTGAGVLTWTATIAPESTLVPVLSATEGLQGERLWVTVDTQGLPTGTYTTTLRVAALPPETQDTPQAVQVVLRVVPELWRGYLPAVLRNARSAIPVVPADPVGPSKVGAHTVAEGDVIAWVQQVHDAGGHVALVKGLTFGHLCDVKRISPETVTIGRWSDWKWETVSAVGDPAAQAGAHMAAHMDRWAPYRSCVDYWEVLNEVDPDSTEGHVWLAEFFKAAMQIADANGYSLALFSYSLGVPEMWEWRAIAETGVFAQAKASGHILSLHEYGWPLMSSLWGLPLPQYPGQDTSDQTVPRYPDRGVVAGRYRHLYRDILIPRGEVIPLAITEANLAIDDPVARGDYFLDEMTWYDDRLREDDYVIGMAIFTLGGSIAGWGHFDYGDFLPDLTQHIIALKDE